MKVLTDKNTYESMVVLSSHCTEVELKEIAFSYAQQLKKLGASDISVISRGRRDFAYTTKKQKQVILLKCISHLHHKFFHYMRQN